MPHPRKDAARERELEKKQQAQAEAARKAEQAKWADDGDKARKAKESRAAETAAKADELARKQREKADLIRQEEEEALRMGKGGKKLEPVKIKRSDIRVSALSALLIDPKKGKKKSAAESDLVHDLPLVPNVNKERQLEEARTGIKTELGTGTGEAISALTAALGKMEIDANPERRMKAAHAAFEERRLKELITEKPGLKRSQYKEMIWKEWLKSPENPMRVIS